MAKKVLCVNIHASVALTHEYRNAMISANQTII